MPNRYIREDAIESEAVNRLSWQAEVFWRRLLNKADDFGRFTANRELLRAAIFPLQLRKVSEADVGRMLLECEHSGLISIWKSDGKEFLVLHKWETGRALHSKYPAPPPEITTNTRTFPNIPQHAPGNVPDSDSDSDSDCTLSLTREQIHSMGKISEVSEDVCSAFFDSMVSVGWVDGRGRRIKSAPHALAGYWRHWQSNHAERSARNGHHKPKRTEAERYKENTGLEYKQPIKVLPV
jgi:hypothetical protein